MTDLSSDASDALTRRVSVWMSASVAAFTPIFSISVIFGWITLKGAMQAAVIEGSCVLGCGLLLGALRVRTALRRVSIRRRPDRP